MVRACAKKVIKKKVEFKLYAPEANYVNLAGDFNDWNTGSKSLKRDKNGLWKKNLNLAPGRYEYKFFVDGNWVEDSSCSKYVTNTFGSRNSVLIVK